MELNKKLNNKGFTLIELLAVIVVLLIISGIAVSSISAAIERNKTKQNDAKKSAIVSYARLYVDEHENSLKGYNCININVLDLDESEEKDSDDNLITGYVIYGDCGEIDTSMNSDFQFVTSSSCNCFNG